MVNTCVQFVVNTVNVERPKISQKVSVSIGRDVSFLVLAVGGLEVWAQPWDLFGYFFYYCDG